MTRSKDIIKTQEKNERIKRKATEIKDLLDINVARIRRFRAFSAVDPKLKKAETPQARSMKQTIDSID